MSENDYYFTTSTARAGETAEWLRYHTRYDGWDYHIVNLTDALGVINISGAECAQVFRRSPMWIFPTRRSPSAVIANS